MAAINKMPRRSSHHDSSLINSKNSTDRDEYEQLRPVKEMKGIKLPLLHPRFSMHSLLEAS